MTGSWRRLGAGLMAVLTAAALVGIGGKTPSPETRVLIVGGSAAKGWHDATGRGYVERGLELWARANGRTLWIANRAIPGSTVLNPVVNQNYRNWLTELHPNVVVIAWGMLNDIREQVPVTTVMGKLHGWIAEALAAHAEVFVVTPMATAATYGIDRQSEPVWVGDEIAMARSFHNPSVLTFNVMGAMQQYLARHHQSVLPLMATPWDPNTAGHRLGGKIFGNELIQSGSKPVGT